MLEAGGLSAIIASIARNMNKLLKATGVSLFPAVMLALSPITAGQAQEITPTSSQGVPATSQLPGRYGLVRSYNGIALEIRGLDGIFRSYTVSPEKIDSMKLTLGDLVAFDTDESGKITRLQLPEVESVFEGTISAIEGELVTVTSSSGQTVTTPVPPATIARLGLMPGKDLMVIQYQGTWATKICCPPVAAADPPTVPSPPVGGFDPQPEPIPALW